MQYSACIKRSGGIGDDKVTAGFEVGPQGERKFLGEAILEAAWRILRRQTFLTA
jgi:hypothetical protein